MGSRSTAVQWLKAADILIFTSWFVVLLLVILSGYESRTIDEFLAIRFSLSNLIIFALLLLTWHLSLLQFGVYEPSPSRQSGQQSLNILKGITFAVGSWVVLGVMFDLSFVKPDFLLLLWGGALVLMLSSRLTARLVLRRRRNLDRFLRRLLIVGLNPRAIKIAREMEESPERGYHVIGFADEPAVGMGCYPLVTDLNQLPEYLRQTAVDEVIVCLPLKSKYRRVVKIVEVCEEQGITVRIMADILPTTTSRSTIDNFGDKALISIHPHGISGAAARTKRAIDIVSSGILLCVLSPIFIVSVFAIKLSSPGPVMFSQSRLGLNKKTFKMLKFRTMVQDAENLQANLEHLNEIDGPAFKISNDPRITRIGGFLRRTSIDELPQLINVIRGEMSLVGPRPLPVRDYEGFSTDWHRKRFSVRPGISGLWQIAGRSNLPFEEWMALDLQYINEWSLTLDFKVLLKTLPAVLRGTGAT
jgi:exopolysaccharide biosynthesis polyprenyl glycosylphosphotransferase